jgi:uncharacterized membrane protein
VALRLPRWARLDFGGIVFGTALAALSLTPSLVPRPALFQGLIAGFGFSLGYAIGAGLFWILRKTIHRRLSTRGIRLAWIILGACELVAVVVVAFLAVGWQNDVRRLVEMPPLDAVDVVTFAVAALVLATICIAIGRGIRRLNRRLQTLAARVIRRATADGRPKAVLAVIASVAATALVIVTIGAGVGAAGMSAVNGIYSARNDTVQTDITQPDSTYRSAGKESAVSWSKLGSQGRAFIGGGPTAHEITAVTDEPAKTPIRVYVGEGQGTTLAERAKIAVAELKRTGAFDRKVLMVATTTGSGWLEPQSVDSLEYLQGGDTAIVSMQYAYTPSWVSFLFDQDLPVAASKALFDAVHAAWAELPADHRPALIAYGLSLGAHGMQSVFPNLDAVRSETDGAVFVGSPNGTPLWNTLQDSRDPGSPLWQPVLNDGDQVRWASKTGDLAALKGPWAPPRVAYLQHATDPVTWLSPTLLWQSPEWLQPGKRGPDVSKSMRWIPVITGVQVLIDMLLGENVPARHGHNYGDVILDAWTAVTPTTDLSAAARARIQAVIEKYAVESTMSE